jgi:hypothetical protein
MESDRRRFVHKYLGEAVAGLPFGGGKEENGRVSNLRGTNRRGGQGEKEEENEKGKTKGERCASSPEGIQVLIINNSTPV